MKTIHICDNIAMNGSEISFDFQGIGPELSMNDGEICERIKKWLLSQENIDVPKIVINLRTVFKDYQEKFFSVEILKKEGFLDDEIVVYKNTQLEKLEMWRNIEGKLRVMRYNEEDGVCSSFRNRDTAYSREMLDIIDFFHLFLQHLYDLKNATSRNLTQEEKNLVTMYKLFYQEVPDFSMKDTSRKFQLMLSILLDLGVIEDQNYHFVTLGNGDVPQSFKLFSIISGLSLFDKLEDIKGQSLDFIVQKKIQSVGKSLRNESSSFKELEALIKLSKVLYASYHFFPKSEVTSQELLPFVNMSQDTTKEGICLLKKIKKDLKEI